MIIVGSEQKIDGRPASYGGTTTSVFLSGTNAMGAPPAGKAYVFVSNVGLRHLGTKGDFVVPGVTGGCFALDNSIQTGNAGTAHAVDPGAKKLALFDANTDCKTPIGEAEMNVAGGDRYLLVGRGDTLETRTMLVVKI